MSLYPLSASAEQMLMICHATPPATASGITSAAADGAFFSAGLLIPAYRCKRPIDGGYSIKFRCPFCRVVHSHGLPPSSGLIHSRAPHCCEDRSPLLGKGYRLLIVGDVRSGQRVLQFCAEDICALNAAVQAR
ncbi:MAG: hypothetical protein R3D69_06445 [Xanthobacteraceae bacterium]